VGKKLVCDLSVVVAGVLELPHIYITLVS